MRLLLRAAVVPALLVLLAACGVTEDEVSGGTTTTASTTTSTTGAEEPSSTTESTTTTTEGGDDPLDENDPELEALLLTADDFDVEVEVADSDAGFSDEEFCEGQSFTVRPTRQASVGFTTEELGTFFAEAVIEFGFEDDASLFLEEVQTLNEACKETSDDDDDVIPATFEPIEDLGDEAIRALPDPGSEGLEVIVVRADERLILLSAFGEPLLTNALIIDAVDRAAP